MSSELRIDTLHGRAIEAVLPELAALRITVFREFPYLYEGSAEYEQKYLRAYAKSELSTVVVARSGMRVIGASTALPLTLHSDEVVPPLVAAGFRPGEVYYFGESVLLAEHRGRGIGHRFFDERERAAHSFGFRIATFCAVQRPDDHPAKPSDYVPHDAFWAKRLPAARRHRQPLRLARRRPHARNRQADGVLGQGARLMRTLRIATAQYPIERAASFQAWRDKQARWLAEAHAHGATLCVLPEYAALELTSLLGAREQADLALQLATSQTLWPRVHDTFQELAEQHALWIVAGTVTERVGNEFRNRARLWSPSGAVCVQEKLQMTRFERESWGISPGQTSTLIETPFAKLGIAICYDAEFPLLVRRLAAAGAELILVPSCTDTLAGYHRVHLSCRARALENQCFVVQAVTVGDAGWSLALDENHGAAGVFGPVDHGFAPDGVLALGSLDAPGWVYAELELDALANVRRNGQVKNFDDWELPGHLDATLSRARIV